MHAGLSLGGLVLSTMFGVGCANDTFATAPDGSVGSDAANDASPADPNVLVGASELQSSNDSETGGNAEAFRFVAAFSGTARFFHFYAASGTNAGKAVGGLYADASGPSTLLAVAPLAPILPGWNVGALMSPVAVSKGTVYWIAILVPKGVTGELHYLDHPDPGGDADVTAGNYFAGFANPWTGGDAGASFTSSPISAYVSEK